MALKSRGIILLRQNNVLDIINETTMLGCRPANSLIKVNHKLCGDVGNIVDITKYRRLVPRYGICSEL